MTMIGTVVGWLLFGLIAGAIARFLHPGNDGMGWGMTMVLGVAGSLLGGGVAYLFHLGDSPYQPGGWILSILGAIVLLAVGAFGTRKRLTP
jgi:uncharacterized membrane protein YeaQ/YmgE (transglycosylase-associated protein family)